MLHCAFFSLSKILFCFLYSYSLQTCIDLCDATGYKHIAASNLKQVVARVKTTTCSHIIKERYQHSKLVHNLPFYKQAVPPIESFIKSAMAFKTIELQVPEGAVDGDSLVFQVNGKELELTIPQGSKPGDVLQIQVKMEDENNEEDTEEEESSTNNGIVSASDSNDVTKVMLHSSIGVCLEIYSCVPHDFASCNDTDDTVVATVDDGTDGTYAMPWPAGLHLAKKISSPKFEKYIENVRNVVELGSGTGLCGIAFVATATYRLSNRKGEAKKFQLILTDRPEATKLLEYNWKMNRHVFSSQTGDDNVCVKPLVWGSRVDDLGFGQVDMILGSDLLYNTSVEMYRDLCNTIQAIDGTRHAKILLSVRWRKPEQERKFFEIMEDAGYDFELVLVDDEDLSLCSCNLTWKEFGNPKCARSNEFFTNTFVQIDNVSKPLKDVMEDDMDVMSDEEYETFEKRFIQLYMGQRRM
jgi:predicted nicotinamide N-methyase